MTWPLRSQSGRQIIDSWDIHYLATIISIEIGFGLILLYMLIHPSLSVNAYDYFSL